MKAKPAKAIGELISRLTGLKLIGGRLPNLEQSGYQIDCRGSTASSLDIAQWREWQAFSHSRYRLEPIDH